MAVVGGIAAYFGGSGTVYNLDIPNAFFHGTQGDIQGGAYTSTYLSDPRLKYGNISSVSEGSYKDGDGNQHAIGFFGMMNRSSAPANPAAGVRVFSMSSLPYAMLPSGSEKRILLYGDTAGGDLTGTYVNPTVRALLGRALSNDGVSDGYILTYTGSAWRPRPSVAVPSGPASGDLTGTYPNPTVAGIYRYPLISMPPSDNRVLMFTGTSWRPVPLTLGVEVYRSTDQAYTAPAPAAVVFDTVKVDEANFFNTGTATRLTIPLGLGGWYTINGVLSFDSASAPHYFQCLIRINGSLYIACQMPLRSTTSGINGEVTVCRKLNVGDYVELLANSTLNGTFKYQADYGNFLRMFRSP